MNTGADEAPLRQWLNVHRSAVGMWVNGLRLADYAATRS